MQKTISFTLTVGGIYELLSKSGKRVRFKFLHVNSGDPMVEIDGKQFEVQSILSLIAPDEFEGLYVIDAPTTF